MLLGKDLEVIWFDRDMCFVARFKAVPYISTSQFMDNTASDLYILSRPIDGICGIVAGLSCNFLIHSEPRTEA